jgi:cobalamin-dependent methionine synthase I
VLSSSGASGSRLHLTNHFISSLLECQLPFQEDNEERIKVAEYLMKQDENAPSLLELFEDDTDKIKNDEHCRQTCYPTYIQVQMHILQLQALRFFYLD